MTQTFITNDKPKASPEMVAAAAVGYELGRAAGRKEAAAAKPADTGTPVTASREDDFAGVDLNAEMERADG